MASIHISGEKNSVRYKRYIKERKQPNTSKAKADTRTLFILHKKKESGGRGFALH